MSTAHSGGKNKNTRCHFCLHFVTCLLAFLRFRSFCRAFSSALSCVFVLFFFRFVPLFFVCFVLFIRSLCHTFLSALSCFFSTFSSVFFLFVPLFRPFRPTFLFAFTFSSALSRFFVCFVPLFHSLMFTRMLTDEYKRGDSSHRPGTQ